MTEGELKRQFAEKGADWDFTQEILRGLNQGTLHFPPCEVKDFPQLDGQRIVDLRTAQEFHLDNQAEGLFHRYFPHLNPKDYLVPGGGGFKMSLAKAEELGLILSQKTAVGLLNGGMATSYGDSKKNQALGIDLFQIYEQDIVNLAQEFQGQPKGITPAFIQEDGTVGYSYVELKLRHMELLNLLAQKKNIGGPGLKLFQMTSQSTDAPLAQALISYKNSPLLADLMDISPWDLGKTPTAVQSLVGTFTLRDGLGNRNLFTTTKSGKEEIYALPGGHGQNFRVLKEIYQELHRQGYLFVYLGNVDNLGFLTSLKSLALLALSGAPAAFDFAFKTPVDVKGGVLIQTVQDKLDCADIGVAIAMDQVKKAQAEGKPILFNCATGLFHLPTLVDQLERIIHQLPIRISEQDKDVGRYAQAEQVTWEVIGLLDRPLILGIQKEKRFLAAKLLIECLLTSGRHFAQPEFRAEGLQGFLSLGTAMNQGLVDLLSGPYAMKKQGSRWVPLAREEVEARLETQPRFLNV